MAGIPGKGGVKGRSGRPPIANPAERYTLRLPPDLRALTKAHGSEWVREAIREKAERERA